MKLSAIDGVLSLIFPAEMSLSPFAVHFDRGAVDYRRRLGGRGGGHLIYKAIGGQKCRVFDATAGWCRDAFLLASLGCDVTAVEKSEIIFKLVQDAIERGKRDEDVEKILSRLHLRHGDALALMNESHWDVIYLDPMFTGAEKKGLNKKDAQILQKCGVYSSDSELEKHIDAAMTRSDRVVVKRPLKGPLLKAQPMAQFKSGSIRFDIYRGTNESFKGHPKGS